MDEMTISISDLLAVMIRKGKQIILIGVALALLLGTFKGVTSWLKLQDEDWLDLEQLEYEQELLKLERTIDRANQNIVDQEEYIANSLWMQINPYDKYVAEVYLTISGVDERDVTMTFSQDTTPLEYLTGKITTQYQILWSAMDLPSELGLSQYSDSMDKYVRELVGISFHGSGVISVAAIGNSESEAQELANAAVSALMRSQPTASAHSYDHTISVYDTVLQNRIDPDMAAAQEDHHERIIQNNDTILGAENAREKLSPPDSILIAVIKAMIIGGIAGVALACAWFGGKSLLQGTIQSSSQVEQALDIPFVGSVVIPSGLFARVAYVLSGERVWADKAQALSYISATVKLRAEGERVLLLSTLPLDAHSGSAQEIQTSLASVGLKPTCAGDFSHNPSALLQLSKCDSVVLLEAMDKTKLGNVSKILQLAKDLKKPVAGFVMI